MDQLEKKLASAQTAVDSAQKAVDEAKDLKDNASEALKNGMYSFFESVGATSAIDALNNCKYASYNQKGSPTDASAIENVLIALDYIDECNELRAKHDLPELRVTDLMMAYAIADANFASKRLGHPVQFNVAENLSWNFSTDDDPFDGWYYEEKENYENGKGGETGHYRNIVNNKYVLTGLALTQMPA